ncbi:acyltransferase family protein [Leucobacter sp. gxy201]|uniref:acyltransferase family protein n=1 Tax=Leucobacter sp. gxy201 TaxID=2957200 RepID=UPI003D9FB454
MTEQPPPTAQREPHPGDDAARQAAPLAPQAPAAQAAIPVEPAAATAEPAPKLHPKPRIALWDNARFALIVLVLVGHMVSTVRTESQFGFAIYVYIYLFHMPAMILLSGMFSRADSSPKIVRSTLQLLAVWLVWEGVWALIHLVLEGQAPGQGFLIKPAWTLWFLVTLVTMRLLLPYIARLRHPLVVSCVLALASGLSPVLGTEFSAARTLVFLPFFVLGWLARDRGWIDGIWFTRPTKRLRVFAWAVFAALALVFLCVPNLIKIWRLDRWLTWRDSYETTLERAPIGALQPDTWWSTALVGIPATAALLFLAALLTFALLIVLPRSTTFCTKWGSRTLFVYLLHGPIVYLLRTSGVIDDVHAWGLLGVPALVIMAVALSALLSMRWVTVVFGPVIEPKIDWLLKRG